MSHDNSSCDAALLKTMVLHKHPDAIAQLARCYGGCLKAVGRARCPTCADAEDAVQEAFLSAIEHLDSFEGRGSLKGWLTTLVIHACYRCRRGRKNDPHLHTTNLPDLAAPSLANPETLIAHTETLTRLTESLGALPSDQRRLLLMATVEGHSSEFIAQHFDITPGAVRTRLSRIRSHLRRAIAETRLSNTRP